MLSVYLILEISLPLHVVSFLRNHVDEGYGGLETLAGYHEFIVICLAKVSSRMLLIIS